MSVYVDDAQIPFRNMLMCHMIADTTEELLTMMDAIGVRRRWIQYQNQQKEHADICKSKRRLAIALGAIEISSKELAMKIRQRVDSTEDDEELEGHPGDPYEYGSSN